MVNSRFDCVQLSDGDADVLAIDVEGWISSLNARVDTLLNGIMKHVKINPKVRSMQEGTNQQVTTSQPCKAPGLDEVVYLDEELTV